MYYIHKCVTYTNTYVMMYIIWIYVIYISMYIYLYLCMYIICIYDVYMSIHKVYIRHM